MTSIDSLNLEPIKEKFFLSWRSLSDRLVNNRDICVSRWTVCEWECCRFEQWRNRFRTLERFVEVYDEATCGKFERSQRLKEWQILSVEGDTGRIRSFGCIKVNNVYLSLEGPILAYNFDVATVCFKLAKDALR